ncbi:hypothetical protein WR25_26582 [Diploscapter pachys]|uniref:Uncharacterized protein n=1 Tax=Diploscapter pachys TaxID=2018661 RepID=A0A2A2M4F7_9BILA|nr:hypothetical protein WR25_26582 [Diploscapter pachys]
MAGVRSRGPAPSTGGGSGTPDQVRGDEVRQTSPNTAQTKPTADDSRTTAHEHPVTPDLVRGPLRGKGDGQRFRPAPRGPVDPGPSPG